MSNFFEENQLIIEFLRTAKRKPHSHVRGEGFSLLLALAVEIIIMSSVIFLYTQHFLS